jgi:hypothetical protein
MFFAVGIELVLCHVYKLRKMVSLKIWFHIFLMKQTHSDEILKIIMLFSSDLTIAGCRRLSWMTMRMKCGVIFIVVRVYSVAFWSWQHVVWYVCTTYQTTCCYNPEDCNVLYRWFSEKERKTRAKPVALLKHRSGFLCTISGRNAINLVLRFSVFCE